MRRGRGWGGNYFLQSLAVFVSSPSRAFGKERKTAATQATHSPTYRIFPPDSSPFAGYSLLQSITIYLHLSPNHGSICFTTLRAKNTTGFLDVFLLNRTTLFSARYLGSCVFLQTTNSEQEQYELGKPRS